MENAVTLQTMKCPTCGGKLKVENPNESIECVYCGNYITPVNNATSVTYPEQAGTITTAHIRIEGLKNPTSALAYLDILFENYPWDMFKYLNNITIQELETVKNELITTSADDKNTWIFCYEITLIPYIKKVECTKIWLDEIIQEYKNGNPDAYGMYLIYNQSVTYLKEQYNDVMQQLGRYIVSAQKYGADGQEIAKLKNRLPSSSLIDTLLSYDNLDQVPAIIAFKQKENALIVQRLYEVGIDADKEYNKAHEYIEQGLYNRALTILYNLQGYLNSYELINEINRYFVLSDVINYNGQLFFLKQEKNQSTYCLYSTSNKKVEEKPILQKISHVISNCANVLYYIDSDSKLHAYDISVRKQFKLGKTPLLSTENMQINKSIGKAYLFTPSNSYQETAIELYELNLIDGQTTCLLKNIRKVLSFSNDKLAYLTNINKKNGTSVTLTAVFDITTHSNSVITTDDIEICGYTDNSVIYTIEAPNNSNKDIYSKKLLKDSDAILLEKNIFSFCDIIDGLVYFYLGNSKSQTLISIDDAGEHRNEISFCIKNILFQKGNWIYFIRGVAYNTVLCRAKLNGSETSIIATEIKKFVSIKNGTLYYIDDRNSLCKVQMDGSFKEYIKHNIDEVICINENKICYTAYDDSVSISLLNGETQTRYIKSIYSININGNDCRKLVYDVDDAHEYDSGLVYYTTPINSNSIKYFNKLDIFSGNTDELLEIKIEPKGGCYIATSVYGSYDCPEVWRFRRYRDAFLANTWYGRAFIKLYYAVSPLMVKYFGHKRWYKLLFKNILDRFNNKLKDKGVDDSPYEDRSW